MDRFTVNDIPYNEALRTAVVDLQVRHATVRKYDTSKPLPEGLATVLIAAAQSASTSSNLQAWSVVNVADPERRKMIDDLGGKRGLIRDAPMFLVFCADIHRLKAITRRRGYPFNCDNVDLLLVATIDCALAAQNTALAAESLGLGICFVGNIRNTLREVSELLELPEGVFATIGLTVGYPAARNAVKPRLPLSSVLHTDRYSLATLERDLAKYDEAMMQTDVYQGRRERVPGVTPEPDQDTAPYGWSEHTARRMASGNPVRRGNAAFLREKGFVLG